MVFMDKQAIIKIYEDKHFHMPLHLPFLGQKDLPDRMHRRELSLRRQIRSRPRRDLKNLRRKLRRRELISR